MIQTSSHFSVSSITNPVDSLRWDKCLRRHGGYGSVFIYQRVGKSSPISMTVLFSS